MDGATDWMKIFRSIFQDLDLEEHQHRHRQNPPPRVPLPAIGLDLSGRPDSRNCTPVELDLETIGPIWVLESSPNPTSIFLASSATPPTSLSKILSCTNNRDPAQQH